MAEHDPTIDYPAAYWEDDGRLLVVRASALGHCIWELAALLQGHDPQDYPEAILEAFRQGHELEPVIIHKMIQAGWKPFDPETGEVGIRSAAQRVGELKVGGLLPKRIVRFHPDEVMVGPRDKTKAWLVEAKALSNDNWERARTKGVESLPYHYDWQLSAMMHSLKLPAVWALYNKDTENLALKYAEEPPIGLAAIVKRVKEVYDVATGPDLVQSGRPCDDPKQWPCLFSHLRPQPEESQLPFVPEHLAEEFKELTVRIQGARAIVETQRQIIETTRAQLLHLAKEAGLDVEAEVKPGEKGIRVGLRNDFYRVKVRIDPPRKKVDEGALADDGLLEKYKVDGDKTRTTVVVESVNG